MKASIYTRHRFHPNIIRRAVWMYFRFNLSFRDVEELMIERGVDVSYETVRRWVEKFGSTFAKRIKSRSAMKGLFLMSLFSNAGILRQPHGYYVNSSKIRASTHSYSYGQARFLRSGTQGFGPETPTRRWR